MNACSEGWREGLEINDERAAKESEMISLGVREDESGSCLLYTSPSPRDRTRSRMPSSA